MRPRLLIALAGLAWLVLAAGLVGPGAGAAHAVPLGHAEAPRQRAQDPAESTPSTTPATTSVKLVTVPPLADAVFTLDGTRYVTGPDGTVVLATDRVPSFGDSLRFESIVTDPRTRAEFLRFARLPEGRNELVYATFALKQDIRFTFADLDETPVPTSRVASMKIKSSIGVEYALATADLDRPLTLPSVRVVPIQSTPEAKEIYYTVQEVIVDGSNIVNRSQQKFFPSRVGDFRVELQFFSVDVAAKDAFFGFANGSAVLVRWPNGTETRHPIVDGKVNLPALPRGEYEMRVDGMGLEIWRPISVSRDQTIDLQLMSALDISFAATVLLVITGSLLLAGRRRSRALKQDRPATADAPMADATAHVERSASAQAATSPNGAMEDEPVLVGEERDA